MDTLRADPRAVFLSLLAAAVLGLPSPGRAEAWPAAAPTAEAAAAEPAAPGANPASGTGGKDTVFIMVPQTQPAPRAPASEADVAFLTERRDRFQRMQSTGFGLLMGGIGAGVGGIALMIMSENQMYGRRDSYGNQEPNIGLFMLGYFSFLAAPPLITTGIILNRIGNGRRARYQRELDALKKVSLDVGVNSVGLTYRF